ncbi:18814_t:CDS:2 [Dentiscutata erythropus]|uniref:18814_t:CDS:1 n=1 Tax=Dentiscutata erythropus TaxID=1348616 RepID=A0A9N8VSJ7_9GLOM|nr:18814_t:CDS:2 [Dentiscutata erythropus]
MANKSNKAVICHACYEDLGDEAAKITNKANLYYNHLKSCLHFASKYIEEELEKILQLDKEASQESDYESNEKAVYYYTQWFVIRPENILLELEDFLTNNLPFNAIPFDQFNSDIIKYWAFIKCGTHKDLANLALHLFGICVNSASVEGLFLTMGFLHSKRKNRLKVLEMSQFQGRIIQERKLKAVEKSAKQIHNPNILPPITSDSEDEDLSQESNFEYN